MNIRKVIKFYFLFVMTVISMAGMTYDDSVKQYVVSVLHIDTNYDGRIVNNSLLNNDSLAKGRKGFFMMEQNNNGVVNFDINYDVTIAHAQPGAKDVQVMWFDLKTFDQDLLIKDLKLKIEGMDPEKVAGVRLINEEKLLSTAEYSDGYFYFKNLDYYLGKNHEGKISLVIDLKDELMTGQRVRFDIEKPEDLVMLVGKKLYTVSDYYPIQGKYLTIARSKSAK